MFGNVDSDAAELLGTLLKALTSFIERDAFARDWLVMRLVMNDVILDATIKLSTLLEQHCLGDKLDKPLWMLLFNVCAKFVTQHDLQVRGRARARGSCLSRVLLTSNRWRLRLKHVAAACCSMAIAVR